MMTGRIVLLGVLMLAGCRTAGPVQLGTLQPGEPLRATYSRLADSVVHSQLVRQVNGSIVVASTASAAPVQIHLLDLENLQVVRGRARGRSTLIGSAAGGFAGILAGMACQASCLQFGNQRILAPLFGFLAGGASGAAVGALLAPPHWVNVTLR